MNELSKSALGSYRRVTVVFRVQHPGDHCHRQLRRRRWFRPRVCAGFGRVPV